MSRRFDRGVGGSKDQALKMGPGWAAIRSGAFWDVKEGSSHFEDRPGVKLRGREGIGSNSGWLVIRAQLPKRGLRGRVDCCRGPWAEADHLA